MISVVLLSVAKIFAIGFLFLSLVLYIYFKRQYKYWGSKNVPCAKPVFPFGNLTGITKNPASVVFQKIYEESKHRKYYGLWLLDKPALMINDPNLIKRILVENFSDFPGNGSCFGIGNDVLFTDNLFSLEGTKWKNLRAKLSPIFSSGQLKAIFPLIVKHSRDLQEVLELSAKMDHLISVKEISSGFIMDTISSVAFGIEINSLKTPENEFQKMMSKIFEHNIFFKLKLFFVLFNPKVAKWLKMPLNSIKVQKFFVDLFRGIVDFREHNNFCRKDVMNLLMQLLRNGTIDDDNSSQEDVESNANKQEFTFENLVSQAMMFLLTGYETTARTMQFALYELAKNTKLQQNLRKEIKTVLHKYNGELTYEAAGEMEYLGRVINETLRKYPNAVILIRQCKNEFKDSELIIDKDTTILVSLFGLHRDERYYPTPEKFDPDRFLDENKSSRQHYSFLPFGEGPRHCIGQRLALLKLKVGLAVIISKFQLEMSESCKAEPLELDPTTITASPKGNIMLKISSVDY